MKRITERPRGIGILKKDGKYIADVQYSLMVVQEYINVDELREEEGQGEITGYLKVVVGDIGNIFHDTFILALEEGRVLGINATCQDMRSKTFNITVNDVGKFTANK